MAGCSMLAVVANHRHMDGVRALLSGLRPAVASIALDSGSHPGAGDAAWFERCLPNVYYNGLLNAACAEAQRRRAQVLYFVCSDVALADPAVAVARARAAFARPGTGLYAPSMNASGHRHMRHRAGAGLRRVSFVEGACFAVRTSLLARLCPIDVEVNALGWGTDVYLGYLTWKAGLTALVDHGVTAVHAGVCGYDRRLAAAQRDAFFAQQSAGARRFRHLTGVSALKTRSGWALTEPLLRLCDGIGRSVSDRSLQA